MLTRPSTAERWGPDRCPGSVLMESRYPETEETPEAAEGTAAHWVATELLQGRSHPIGQAAPNGWVIDADMIEGAQLLLDVASAEIKSLTWPAEQVVIERRFGAPTLIHPENLGQPDCVILARMAHRAVAIEYKYGHGYVEEWRNPQLINQFAVVFETYGVTLQECKGWEICGTIVQPRFFRGDRVRRWECLGHELWAEIERLKDAAHAANAPDAPTHAGDYCRHCAAAHDCDAYQRSAAIAMDIAGHSNPLNMTGLQAGAELRQLEIACKRIEGRYTALAAVVEAKMRDGESVPFWSMKAGQSNLKWVVPSSDAITIADALGVDIRKPMDTMTPTQAIAAGLPKTVVDNIAKRPPVANKLTLDSEASNAKRFTR